MIAETRRIRCCFALLILGSAAFTLLGSLVPFEFRHRDWNDAVDSFTWAMTNRVQVQSRSDAVANVLLGVPLGFGLLGLVCVDRAVPRRRTLLLAMLMLPGCIAFAAAVEFAQLFVPVRTCAGSDVLAQSVGAALGMAAWIAFGQRLTDEMRMAATGTGTATRFLVGYLLLLGFMQALPLDLTLSPADAYRKFRDGGVKPIPFGEFRTLQGDATLGRIATLLKLAALYLPVGLLAAWMPGRFWQLENFTRVLLAAIALALTIELAQVLVKSRTTNATDVVIGAAAAYFGWLIGRGHEHGLSCSQALIMGPACLGLVFWVSFQPFEPGPPVPFDWIPGMPLEGGNPLLALEEMLIKLIVFGLIGAVLVGSDVISTGRAPAVAVIVGLLASGLIEFGQTRFVGHSPGITDVLLGGLGAFCGSWIAGRVRTGAGERGMGVCR